MPSLVNDYVSTYRNDWGYEAYQPAEPTDTEVGSAARIIAYRQRVAQGSPIFIDGDRRGSRPARAYSAPSIGYGIQSDGDERRGQAFDDHYRYRYLRWYRFKRAAGRHVVFVGFRPDDSFDRQAAAWAMFHQFNRVSIVNVYGTLTPNVQEQVDPVGALNDMVIRSTVSTASIVVLAWGGESVELFDCEVIERIARMCYALRRQLDSGVLKTFGYDRGQPVGIRPHLGLMDAPRVDGEQELVNEDD